MWLLYIVINKFRSW